MKRRASPGPGDEETRLAEATRIFDPARTPTWELLEQARRVRVEGFGNRVHLCAILNAKSGACGEDCAFCSQSRRHRCAVEVYPLVSKERILEAARAAEAAGARCFSLVTSGRSLNSRRERRTLLEAVEAIRSRTRLEAACSLGLATLPFLRELKSAGLTTYHHNLETAAGYYDRICTTHSFEQRLETVSAAREAGLVVCSGGIFGMGETVAHRAELALTLRELEVERIPVNFLNPIPGTRLEHLPRLTPLEALHVLAALRVLVPRAELLVCGGREVTLRALQPLLFLAGANGIMTGRYLTTDGQGPERDREMLEDLGLRWRPEVPGEKAGKEPGRAEQGEGRP